MNKQTFTESDVIALLRSAVETAGSQAKFAREHGFDQSLVALTLGDRRPAKTILDALGLEQDPPTYHFKKNP